MLTLRLPNTGAIPICIGFAKVSGVLPGDLLMATQSDSGIDQVKSADAGGAEKATPPNLSKEEKKRPADAAEKGTPPKLSKADCRRTG